MSLIIWLRWCLSGFSIANYSFFPLSHTVLFGRKSPGPAHRWEVRIYPLPPWGWSIHINCLEFFMGDLSLFPYLFTSLSNPLFILVWTHGYSFSTLGYNPTLRHLSCSLNYSVFGYYTPPIDFFWSTSLPLVLQNASGPSSVFPAPVLQWTISSRSTGSFYCRMIIETRIWELGVFLAIGMSLLLGSLTE